MVSVLFTPEQRLLGYYRLARWCYMRNLEPVAKILYRRMSNVCGAKIHYRAELGPRFRVHHGYGVIVSRGVKVGENVHVSQYVTIGGNWFKERNGQVFPVIGDNVWIMAGAIVAGPIHVGSNVIIGANSIVTDDVPDNVVVAGSPARVIRTVSKRDIMHISGSH